MKEFVKRGEKTVSVRSVYYNHCWRCKADIDSIHFRRCPVCGWFICHCGACGCEYNKKEEG